MYPPCFSEHVAEKGSELLIRQHLCRGRFIKQPTKQGGPSPLLWPMKLNGLIPSQIPLPTPSHNNDKKEKKNSITFERFPTSPGNSNGCREGLPKHKTSPPFFPFYPHHLRHSIRVLPNLLHSIYLCRLDTCKIN